MFCTNCGHEIADTAAVCANCGVEVGKGKKFCADCGRECGEDRTVCSGCGHPLQSAPEAPVGGKKIIRPGGRSAALAAILSCVIPGLGQLYLGQVTKGAVMFITHLVWLPVWFLAGGLLFSSIIVMTGGVGIVLLPVRWALYLLPWLAILIDAARIGRKLERGRSVGEWEFF